MKKLITLVLITLVVNLTVAQTAMDFEGVDCNGNQVHLFSDLDADKAVVLFYYMPNCGSCPPPAAKIQTMANNINALYPGKVKGYAYPYQNVTSCSYSASWVTSNNLPLYTPMDSGAVQVAYYGGFGMPTVVLLGGSDHRVLWSTQDFSTSDTTIMRDSILGLITAGIQELSNPIKAVEVYPNPSSDVLNLQFMLNETTEFNYQVLSIDGKVVAEGTPEIMHEGMITKEINVEEIPNGTYFVQIKTSDHLTSQKITIRH